MEKFNEQLKEYQVKIAQKSHYESVLSELEYNKNLLELKLPLMKKTMDTEQTDVDRLEKNCFATLFYVLVGGGKSQRLDREKKEALAASAKYHTAVCELEAIEKHIKQVKSELLHIAECEEKYEELIKEREQDILNNGMEQSHELLKLRLRAAEIDAQLIEIDEAEDAGRRANATAASITETFNKATGYGTFGGLMGGNVITDIGQRSAIERTQELIENMQVQLLRFKTELADVDMSADIQVSVNKFLRLADMIFDGFVGEFAVSEMISRSQQNITEAQMQINSILTLLSNKRDTLISEQNEIKASINKLVLALS